MVFSCVARHGGDFTFVDAGIIPCDVLQKNIEHTCRYIEFLIDSQSARHFIIDGTNGTFDEEQDSCTCNKEKYNTMPLFTDAGT